MSFVTKSANYSQSVLLKNKILRPLLKLYNDYLLKQNILKDKFCLNKDINTGTSSEFIIPNNNKKYYLFITKKSHLEKTKENYNILYFFPDDYSINSFESNNIVKNTLSDFYLEINNEFADEYLFEGYLYNDNDKQQFLITDILIKNNTVVSMDYNMRLTVINEIILDINLQDLNNCTSINLHPVFSKENENLIKIFKKNFIYRSDICCIELINNFTKTRFVDVRNIEDCNKTIQPGKYSDVYNVYNIETNNYEGILYIKGLKESRYIRNLMALSKTGLQKIILKCKYNYEFKKWHHIIENDN
jgi:hypothetical protein